MEKEAKEKSKSDKSIENIYKLDGRVPIGKAIPYGLQHVLAMFVSNLTPIMLSTDSFINSNPALIINIDNKAPT